MLASLCFFVATDSRWMKIYIGATNLWDPWDVSVTVSPNYTSEFYNNCADIYLPTISATLPATLPSVLWRCWLGGRKGIRHVKNWAVGCRRGYLSGARCILANGPADATATHCLLLQHKSRLVLPFWYRLTRVVPDKGPLNGGVHDSNITAERGGGVLIESLLLLDAAKKYNLFAQRIDFRRPWFCALCLSTAIPLTSSCIRASFNQPRLALASTEIWQPDRVGDF